MNPFKEPTITEPSTVIFLARGSCNVYSIVDLLRCQLIICLFDRAVYRVDRLYFLNKTAMLMSRPVILMSRVWSTYTTQSFCVTGG